MDSSSDDSSSSPVPAYVAVHSSAVEQGLDTYIDPQTGFTVFTSLFLKKRGFCCKSGCRHCPYEIHTPS